MRNKKLAEKIRKQPCIVCFKKPTDCDHIFAYGRDEDKDTEENCWALCRGHHNEKGNIGLVDFVKKYNLEEEMVNRSAWFDGRRWRKHFTEIK